jgi:hypothetical protein
MEPEPRQEQTAGPDPEETTTGLPRCPSCGWQNVRLSHSRGALDSALVFFSIHAFRCRSCGLRFHRFHRKPADVN